MHAAIVTLEIALDILETNEPIHRAAGDEAQADGESRQAREIRDALALLRATFSEE